MEIIIAIIALGIIIFVGYSMLSKESDSGRHPLDSVKVTTEVREPSPEPKYEKDDGPLTDNQIQQVEESKIAVAEKIEAKSETAPSKPKKKYYHNKPKSDAAKKTSTPKKPAPSKAPNKTKK